MCSATRLLIIDDDLELCELLVEYLGSAGFMVDTVGNAEDGVRRALSGQYAAAVLDVMLPGFDGFEVLRRVRAQSGLPILMLTARGEEVDRIVGLEVGADDYLPKPFSPRELVARLRAILRRVQSEPHAALPDREPIIVVDDLQLDPAARTVLCTGRPIELTSAEFDLLEALMLAAGKVVTRDDLSRGVFGRPLQPEDRSIDVHMSNLRRKLGKARSGAERIKTLRGTGYIFTLSAIVDARVTPNTATPSSTA